MEWEIFEYKTRFISAEVEAGKLKYVSSGLEHGFSARVILNGRVGFASASTKDEALSLAEKIAKVSENELDDFPCEKPVRVKGIYDRKVEEVDSEFIMDEFERLKSAADKANIAAAKIEHAVEEVRITNSFGLESYEKSTSSSFMVEAVFQEGSAYEVCESRSIELDIEEAVKRAERLAVDSASAVKIDSGFYDVVLQPIAVHQLLSNTLYPSLSAENVEKGRSAVKLGDEFGRITIIDDPTVEGGLMSCGFDDEGVSARKTVLTENGVVKSYYTDWKHSKKYGVTGNGFRLDNSIPSPMVSNVVIETEKCENDNCLVIHSLIGSHTANPVSGEFSLECNNAYFKGMAVKGAMIYGNVFDLLKKVEGGLEEVRQVENTITKSLRFEGVRVI
ncbi:TldD/PmbA family protein [Archaeoglobus sp.]